MDSTQINIYGWACKQLPASRQGLYTLYGGQAEGRKRTDGKNTIKFMGDDDSRGKKHQSIIGALMKALEQLIKATLV